MSAQLSAFTTRDGVRLFKVGNRGNNKNVIFNADELVELRSFIDNVLRAPANAPAK